MKFTQNFVSNTTRSFSTLDIVNIYNTHTYGEYYKILSEDPRDMHYLIITLDGQCDIILKDNSSYNLSPGNSFIGSIKTIKALHSNSKHWHFIIFWFIPINLQLPENKMVTLKNISLKEIEAIANNMIELLQTYVDNKIYYANSMFYCLLSKILEQLNPYTEKSNKLIQEIVKYINSHIEEPLLIEELSNKFGYCSKHIRYLFKTALNFTPKQYINKVKLEHISDLLSNSSIPIQELAEKFSFNSANHLCNNFKKEYNISPREYREKHNLNIK